MAQTWPVTPRKRAALMVADVLARGASLIPRMIWRPRRDEGKGIRKILVIEMWLIGDVVLVSPLLQALRARFPDARITLLAKPHAEELLRHSGLVDEVIAFDFPWTATERKYQPGRYDRRAIGSLIGRLRRERFDLTIDCRMDVRSNIVAFATGAPHRIGYDFGGGSYLLTDALPASPDALHKVDDWLALLEPLDGAAWAPQDTLAGPAGRLTPLLSVTAGERAEARRRLRALGVLDDDIVVGIHPGASNPRRRWPLEDFAWVADSLAARGSGIASSFPRRRESLVPLVFVDPGGYGAKMPCESHACFLSTTLRELMATLTHCDVLICNDSGPMHIADALGVPVVGVFTTGNPDWHRPYGANQKAVGRGTGHDFVSSPTRDEVLAAAHEQLRRSSSSSPRWRESTLP